MSAEKKHDYHLVDPSPWPIYTSFSCLVLAIGTIFYMHNGISWGMYLGLALLIYGAYMWFRDVVIEAEHQGHHTPVVQIHHRYGMTLFIASEVMFFVAWFWAYFDVSLFPNEFVGNVWPPKDIETFDELLDVIRLRAKNGEIFIRLDLKPPFPDTPENWEDKVESVFSSYIK